MDIAQGVDIRARLYTLAPGDVIPRHHHTAITEWYFCPAGTLRVQGRVPTGASPAARGTGSRPRPRIASRTAVTRIAGFCCCRV
ncbi:MAG: hypothetical protein J2P48_22380 [Alphaproteobacteria bacterium]|nr:hypothetical protein [Alphaproteobacteria bacterium]